MKFQIITFKSRSIRNTRYFVASLKRTPIKGRDARLNVPKEKLTAMIKQILLLPITTTSITCHFYAIDFYCKDKNERARVVKALTQIAKNW